MRDVALSLVLGLTVFGCSATGGDASGFGGNGAGNGNGNGSASSGDTNFTVSAASGSGAGSGAGCSDAAKLIYVLSDANDLYSFRPDLKLFKKVGPLKCQANGAQPNSMAIDRDAVAWVNYVTGGQGIGDTAGSIFKVSTSDASCTPTSIKLTSGWFRLGMGYSTDTVGGTSETLFVTGTSDPLGPSSLGLGKIDFKSNSVTPIGPFGGALDGENAELTGTGDARVFGFFTTSPVRVAELNKATGAAMKPVSLPKVQTPDAWAFSFWGGDFYLYTASGGDESTVSHYRPSDGTTDAVYMTNIGFTIVGAGVSTCAPLVPPK